MNPDSPLPAGGAPVSAPASQPAATPAAAPSPAVTAALNAAKPRKQKFGKKPPFTAGAAAPAAQPKA